MGIGRVRTSAETTPTMKTELLGRAELLDKAKRLVNGDRDQEYGGPEDSFASIAIMWNAYFEASGREVHLLPYEIALLVDLLKTCRLIESAGTHADSWVDKAGYASCGSEVALGKGKGHGLDITCTMKFGKAEKYND